MLETVFQLIQCVFIFYRSAMKNFQRIISIICLLLLPLAMSVSVEALQGTSKHNKQFKTPAQPVQKTSEQIQQETAIKNYQKKTATEDNQGKTLIKSDSDYGRYMQDLQRRIGVQWEPPYPDAKDSVAVSFQVLRDGSLVTDSVKITSSTTTKDAEQAVLDAINKASKGFRPLPAGAAERVTINFTFTKTHPLAR